MTQPGRVQALVDLNLIRPSSVGDLRWVGRKSSPLGKKCLEFRRRFQGIVIWMSK